MDRVAMIDEEMFVTGGDNGSISLWVTHKKKPIFILPLAHGIDPPLTPEEASAERDPRTAATAVPAPSPRWITALTTIPYSDVILSGSWDGHLRAWKVSDDRKKIETIGVLGSLKNQTSAEMSTKRDTADRMASDDDSGIGMGTSLSPTAKADGENQPIVRGVINDISIFERGDRGRDGACIVVAIGKEHRLGRWKRVPGKNGAMVFEVPTVKRLTEERKKDA